MVTDSTCMLGKDFGILEQKGLDKRGSERPKRPKVFVVNTFGRIIKFDVVPAAQTLARRYFAPKTSVA